MADSIREILRGFVGTIGVGGAGPYLGVPVTPEGAGGVYVGAIGEGGAAPDTGPFIGTSGAPWEAEVGAGAGSIAGEGGAAGSSDEPPAVGTVPLGGTGGWVGIPK